MADEIRINQFERGDEERLTTGDLAGIPRSHTTREPELSLRSGTSAPRVVGESAYATTRQKVAEENEVFAPLLSSEETASFRARWDNIQVKFVDEPQRSVEEADSLVAETMKRLAETFARERDSLEHQWDRGGEVSTEDLRMALRRYRSFFGRLVRV
jgi:hypothetical protein